MVMPTRNRLLPPSPLSRRSSMKPSSLPARSPEPEELPMSRYDIAAIDAVVNIWTAESIAIRPNRDAFFGGKMNVGQHTLQGVPHEEMLRRMDAAGIERSFLIAT